jgi:Lar family restriction alleviation protein
VNLKPCPFCGCTSLWLHIDNWNCAVVECDNCDAVGPIARPSSLPDDEKLAEAARLWNQRQEVTA